MKAFQNQASAGFLRVPPPKTFIFQRARARASCCFGVFETRREARHPSAFADTMWDFRSRRGWVSQMHDSDVCDRRSIPDFAPASDFARGLV